MLQALKVIPNYIFCPKFDLQMTDGEKDVHSERKQICNFIGIYILKKIGCYLKFQIYIVYKKFLYATISVTEKSKIKRKFSIVLNVLLKCYAPLAVNCQSECECCIFVLPVFPLLCNEVKVWTTQKTLHNNINNSLCIFTCILSLHTTRKYCLNSNHITTKSKIPKTRGFCKLDHYNLLK